MEPRSDTIVAQATPPGRGGVGIVRISGPKASEMVKRFVGKEIQPRYAHYGPFKGPDNESIDVGITLFFQGPNSFTGEDVVELQGHGGPVVIDLLIQAALQYGARVANPGEFTQRAFLNNRMDLAQAEAVADLINASSEQAARCAVRSLAGDFSKIIHNFLQGVIGLRTYLEAANDFPDEEVEILAGGEVEDRLERLEADLIKLKNTTRRGVVLQEGLRIAVVGKPNAGKSSLFNALTGDETAIVTDIAGTTRDLIREQIHLGSLLVHLVDTAGIRKDAENIEQEGIRRAQMAAETADRLLFVLDGHAYSTDAQRYAHVVEILGASLYETFKDRLTVVVNKIDLIPQAPKVEDSSQGYPQVFLSAQRKEGIDELRAHLKAVLGDDQNPEQSEFTARRRHLEAMDRAQAALKRGVAQLSESGAVELLAEDLRSVQLALDEVTGVFSQDDLLGEIFSSFCIGK